MFAELALISSLALVSVGITSVIASVGINDDSAESKRDYWPTGLLSTASQE